jgi:Fis family transcriptional regulator
MKPTNIATTTNVHNLTLVKNKLNQSEQLLSQNKPLRTCADEALQEYFSNLNGHKPSGIYNLVLQEIEIPLLKQILKYTGGNQSRAAILLGINRGTLRKKLKTYGMLD